MKIYALLAALLMAPTAWAQSSPAGDYYVPFEAYADGSYRPEQLIQILADGNMLTHSVHDGKREIYSNMMVITGTNVTVLPGSYMAMCPLIHNDELVTTNLSYVKSNSNVTFSNADGAFTLENATPEQKNKVLNLPACP